MVVDIFAVRKWQEMLAVGRIEVEGHDLLGTRVFGREGQETRRGADIENPLARQVDAADVIGEATAQIPCAGLRSVLGEIDRMIEEAFVDRGSRSVGRQTLTGRPRSPASVAVSSRGRLCLVRVRKIDFIRTILFDNDPA